jgi:hypothetical protein
LGCRRHLRRRRRRRRHCRRGRRQGRRQVRQRQVQRPSSHHGSQPARYDPSVQKPACLQERVRPAACPGRRCRHSAV